MCVVLLTISNSLSACIKYNDTIPPVISEVPEEILYESQDKDYTQIKTASSDCILNSIDKKYGLRCNDKQILPMDYSIDKNIEDKVFIFRTGLSSGIYNVIENRWILPIDNISIKHVEKNYFLINYPNDVRLIDLDGKDVFSTKVKEITYAGQNDLFIVRDRTEDGLKMGLFSASKNKFILDVKYDRIASVSNSVALRVKDENGYRLFNPNSNKWSINWYDKILECIWSNEARVIIKKGIFYGVINMQEDLIVPIQYTSIKELHTSGNMLFGAISIDGKTNAFTVNGKLAIEGLDQIESLTYDKLRITKDHKHGLATIQEDSIIILLDIEYDEISNAFGVTVVNKNGKYNIFCDLNSEFSKDLPFDELKRLKTRTIIVKTNGWLTSINTLTCEVEPPTNFTSFEYLRQNHPSVKSYHYMKAKKESGPYYLTNGKLIQISDVTFYDILATNGHYVFFKNVDGKIGVYHGLKDTYIIKASFDKIEFKGKNIYLSKDGKKGTFRNGQLIF